MFSTRYRCNSGFPTLATVLNDVFAMSSRVGHDSFLRAVGRKFGLGDVRGSDANCDKEARNVLSFVMDGSYL
jgi:lysophospholipid acyltransferase (LPLAT)-like uncharacterized protein